MERTAIFLDGGYIKKAAMELGSPYPDLLKLSELLCELSPGARRFRTYYYDCMPYQGNPPTSEERDRHQRMDRFVASIRKLPSFEVRLGRLQRTQDGFRQKMVDILLSIDLTRLASKQSIQRAILVTGDSDFVPAVKLAKDDGVTVHLFFARGKTVGIHDELYTVCDERTELTKSIFEKARLSR